MVYVEDPYFLQNEAATNAPRLILAASSFKSTHQVPWTVDNKGRTLHEGITGKLKYYMREHLTSSLQQKYRHSC